MLHGRLGVHDRRDRRRPPGLQHQPPRERAGILSPCYNSRATNPSSTRNHLLIARHLEQQAERLAQHPLGASTDDTLPGIQLALLDTTEQLRLGRRRGWRDPRARSLHDRHAAAERPIRLAVRRVLARSSVANEETDRSSLHNESGAPSTGPRFVASLKLGAVLRACSPQFLVGSSRPNPHTRRQGRRSHVDGPHERLRPA
jgi:hypothetical protein